MEAVPRMPMLSFELKTCSEHAFFDNALNKFIQENFGENPNDYYNEIKELNALRLNATRVSKDFIGCSTLKKYYCQLAFLQTRFPFHEGLSEEVELMFTWDDVYTGRQVIHADIRFEQACILYNIGALHSVLGAMDNRQTPEGMKVSCTHFQCAAWAFQHLRDYYSSSFSNDMSHDLLSFQYNLMLAQAQECILEKSMTDNRKSTITAKVAAQIVEYYKQASKYLDGGDTSSMIGSSKKKEWKKRIDLKIKYEQCVMYLYVGNQVEEQQKWGERLAYFQGAIDRLNECIKLAKGEEDMQEAMRFTMDVVGGKYNAAKKDNDFIYHEKIPDLESLPEIRGASLVKGIGFNTQDTEVSGPDIFARLVPMQAHEASSLYSEEKAKLLRRIGSEVEEKNAELQQFLASLQIDPAQLSQEPEWLPESLVAKCAALSVRSNTIKDLVTAMQDVSGLSMDVNCSINELESLLLEENTREKEFTAIFGHRPQNIIITESSKELSRYKEAHTKAGQSNQELHKAMNTHIQNLKLLGGPLEELQKAIPAVQVTPEEDAVRQEMLRLKAKIDEMQSQRTMLEERLRKQVHDDDITNKIVTTEDGSTEKFFQEELSKHSETVSLIEQNLAAQEKILKAVTAENARFANTRKSMSETIQRREAMIAGLITSYDVYEDLLAKSQKGIEFYRKLETNVTKLLQRIRGVARVQEEERQHITQRNQPKGPPPSRPTAPKPGESAMPMPAPLEGPTLKDYLPYMKPATFGNNRLPADGLPPPSLPSTAVAPPMSSPDGPKLKDFLPFMKPATFGKKDNVSTGVSAGMLYPGMGQPGSLPSSQTASPIHVPRNAASHPASPLHQPHSGDQGVRQPPSDGQAAMSTQSWTGAPPVVSSQPYNVPGMSGYGQQIPSSMARGQPTGAPMSAPQSGLPPRPEPSGAAPPQATQGIPDRPDLTGVPHGVPTRPEPSGAPHSARQEPNGSSHGQQQQQQVRPESAHTVDSLHTPIASPGTIPQGAEQQVAPPSGVTAPSSVHGMYQNPQQNPNYAAVPPTPQQFAGNQAGSTAGQSYPQSMSPRPATYGGAPQPATASPASLNQQGYKPAVSAPYSAGYSSQAGGYTPQPTSDHGSKPQGTTQQQQPMMAGYPQPAGYVGHPYPQTPYSQSSGQPSATNTQQPTAQNYAQYYQNQNHPPASYATGYAPPAASQAVAGYGQAGQKMAAFGQPGSLGGSHAPAGYARPSPSGSPAPAPAGYNTQVAPGSQQAGPYQQQQMMGAGQQTGYRAQTVGGYGQPSQVPQGVGVGAPANSQSQRPADQTRGAQSYTMPQYSQAGAPPSAQGHSGQQAAYGGYAQQQPHYQPGYRSAYSVASSSTTSYVTPTSSQQFQPRAAPGQRPQTYPQNQTPQGQVPAGYVTQQQGYNQNSYPTQMGASGTTGYGQPASVSQPGPTGQYQPANTNNQMGHYQQGVGQTNQLGYPQQVGQYQPAANTNNQQRQYQAPPAGINQPNSYATQASQFLPANGNQQVVNQQYQPPASGQVYPQPTNQQLPPQPTNQQHPQQPTNQQAPQHPRQPVVQTQGYDPSKTQGYPGQPAVRPANQGQPFQQPQPTGHQPMQPLQPVQTMGHAQSPQPALSPQPPTIAPSVAPTVLPPSGQPSQPAMQPPQPGVLQRQLSATSTTSSTDDLLSSSPESSRDALSREKLLKPKVLTAEDIARQKEEELKNNLKNLHIDPYQEQHVLDKFVADVEKLENFVEGLTKPTLKGPTPLDCEWKEVMDTQDRECRKQSMAIARCYPLKNRQHDIMPYDSSRVLLTSGKDDYINASHIDNLDPSCPKFITTQAPLPVTLPDFWLMVYEQGTEVIVMLNTDAEAVKLKCDGYFPTDRGQQMKVGAVTLTLQSCKVMPLWTERVINISHGQARQARNVMHIQSTSWPQSVVPESPAVLLHLITEVHNYYKQQRSLMKPVIVHCSVGCGRSGLFCAVYAGVQQIDMGQGIPSVPELVQRLWQKRKFLIEDKQQYQFIYQAILYHGQDLLMKRGIGSARGEVPGVVGDSLGGILTHKASFGDKLPSPADKTVHPRKPQEDFIMGTSNLSAIQTSISHHMFKHKPHEPPHDINQSEPTPMVASGSSTDALDVNVNTGGKESHSANQVASDKNSVDTIIRDSIRGHSRTGSNSSLLSSGSGPTTIATPPLSGSPQHKSTMPAALADLQNPNTFSMSLEGATHGKKRITKQSFNQKTGSLQDVSVDASDPLSQLDPLWTMKEKKGSGEGKEGGT